MNTKETILDNDKCFDVLERISFLMSERGWSQNELAKRAGMTQSTVSSWYSRNYCPSVPTIERVCKAFGITLTEFFLTDDDHSITLTEKQRKLLLAASKLSDVQLDKLIKLIESL